MLASIPAPPSNALPGLGIRYYGLMIALGVLAGVWLGRKRWAERGHDPDEIADLAVWMVPAGLVGTRIYHVITDWDIRYDDGRWWPDAFQIWNGGLGIPGGIFFGVLAGLLGARHYKMHIPSLFDALAPSLPLAQAIGRFGNYFNQELYGSPTDLPWALEVDPQYRPPEHLDEATFHPTFLYEGLWNIGVVLILLRVDRTRRLRPSKLFPLYLFGYFTGRLWVEAIRIDPAQEIFGLRVNIVMALTMIVVSAIWFFWGGAFTSDEERADLLAVRPWQPPAAGSADPEVDGGVGEDGPEVDGPSIEVDEAETDEAEAPDRVDPQE